MAESKRRPRKLKGAVLIMVVTMLFVLIVMLLATLTVVSNANRRTITKFEENQAYYTARSALEVYINEMLEDQQKISEDSDFPTDGADIIDAWEGIKSAKTKSLVFSFDGDASDLETNLGNDKDFTGKDITKGFIHQQEIFCNLSPKYVVDPDNYDDTTGTPSMIDYKKENFWKKATDEITGFKEENCYVEYTAVLPKTSLDSDSYGKLADDNLDGDGRGEVNIKIELLRMLYKDSEGNIIYDGSYVSKNTNDIDATTGRVKMSAIDWNQTYYRLKVTATTSVSDKTGGSNESTVSVLLEPNPQVNPASFTNAMTSFSSTTVSSYGNVVGGGSASAPGATLNLPNTSVLDGNYVYEYGQVYSGADGPDWHIPENGYIVVRNGFLKIENAKKFIYGSGAVDATEDARDSRPFIYSAGFTGQKLYIGDDDQACDLILAPDKDSATNMFGSDSEATNIGDYSNVAFVTGSNDTKINGDVYVDGDIVIRDANAQFNGDIYCTGDIYFAGDLNKVSITGYIHLTSGGNVYAKDWSNGGAYDVADLSSNRNFKYDCKIPAGSLKIPTNTDGTYKTDDFEISKDYLPGRSKSVTIHSAKSVTESYRDAANDLISAKDMFQKSSNSDKASLSVKTSVSMTKDNATGSFTYNGNTYSHAYVPTETNYNSDTGFYEYKLNFSDFSGVGPAIVFHEDNADDIDVSKVYYIDATQGNVQIELTSGGVDSAEPTFVVVGNNSVVFTIKDNGGTVEHKGFQVFNEQIFEMVKDRKNSSNVFEFGDETYFSKLRNDTTHPEWASKPDTPSAPKIYYYIGKNAKLYTKNGDNMFLCGYAYGPEATFENPVNNSSKLYYTHDGGDPVNSGIKWIGSIVFDTIKVGNGFGIGFVPPEGGGEGSMIGTMITWDRQRYLGR